MPWKDTSHEKWKSTKDEEKVGWDSSWKGDGGTRRRGKGGKKGRSRSRRKQHAGKREWQDGGQDEWKEWKQHGGDQWHQGGGSTWSGNSWKNDRWQGAAPWDLPQPLRCTVHGKTRSWDKLVEGPEGWVCREAAPCFIYVGGSNASNCDLRTLLDEVKGHCDRPNRSTGGAGKVGRVFRTASHKHSRSSKGCATSERSDPGRFSRSNKHSQWADDRNSGRRHVEPRGGRLRDRQALGSACGTMTPVMMSGYPVIGPCFPQVVPIGQKQQQQHPAGAVASPSLTSNMIDVEDL